MEQLTKKKIGSLVALLQEKSPAELSAIIGGSISKESITWFKSIFIKGGVPTETLSKLLEKPDSDARQSSFKAAIAEEIEDHPKTEKLLKEIIAAIEKKTGKTNTMNVKGDNNNVFQDVKGSTIHIGNTVKQTHHGSGDNVAGDKIVK